MTNPQEVEAVARAIFEKAEQLYATRAEAKEVARWEALKDGEKDEHRQLAIAALDSLRREDLTPDEVAAVLHGTDHVTYSKQKDKYRRDLRSARVKLAAQDRVLDVSDDPIPGPDEFDDREPWQYELPARLPSDVDEKEGS